MGIKPTSISRSRIVTLIRMTEGLQPEEVEIA